MDNLKTYLLTIVLVTIVTSIIVSIANNLGIVSRMIKLLCSIFVTITFLFPIVNVTHADLANLFRFEIDTESIIAEGEAVASVEKSRIIKAQTEAYITNKAATLGANVDVTVMLADQEPLIPVCVRISGDISPYIKRRLQQIISNDIGLHEEALQWD